MGLYDNYKLANSTAIPMFEGSAGEDFIKVGQYKQGMYDQDYSGGIKLGGDANEVSSSFQQDQGAVNELRSTTQKQLGDIATRGDWENAGPELQALGQHFANRSREIAAPMQQAAEYRKSLDDEKKDLTPEQKQALYGMSVKGYQGLQKNAQGQYVGTFTGRPAAKNIDVNKKVDEWLKDTVAHEGGDSYETTSDGDMWIMKRGVKFKQVPAQTQYDSKGNVIKVGLKDILNAAKSNDQEYQAFKGMQGDIAAYQGSQVYGPQVAPDGPLKTAAMKLMPETGLPFNEVYSRLARAQAHNDIENNTSVYGIGKYAVDNRFTEQGIKENPYTLKKAKDSSSPDAPYMLNGANTQNVAPIPFDKLQSNTNDAKTKVQDLQGTIDRLNKDLTNKTNLRPDDITAKQSQIQSLNKQVEELKQQSKQGEAQLNYAKDKQARTDGYDSYQDFINKKGTGIKAVISKVFPNGIPIEGGKVISNDELVQAAADGRISSNIISPGGPGGKPFMNGATVTLKDGRKVPINGNIGNKLVDSVNEELQGKSKSIADFQDNVSKNFETNSEGFSIKNTYVDMPDTKDREDITRTIKANINGVKWSTPGQLNSIDAPKNFHIVGHSLASLPGDAKYKAEELDETGKPVPNSYFDVTVPESNLDEVQSRKLGASKDIESIRAADALAAHSGAREVNKLTEGDEIPVNGQGQSNGKLVNISKIILEDGNYHMVDDKGNIIKDKYGNLKSTPSAVEAGEWIDDLRGTPTYRRGTRTDIIDKRRDKTKQ